MLFPLYPVNPAFAAKPHLVDFAIPRALHLFAAFRTGHSFTSTSSSTGIALPTPLSMAHVIPGQ